MIEKSKKNKYQIMELIIIFIITLISNLLFSAMIDDEIWCYGFSYNIVSGLIPYKDFNMVITPLYPIIGGLFMYMFGKNIVVYHIFNAIVCITIFYYIKKIIPKSYYIPYAIILLYSTPHYNLFCLMLLLIIINLEEKKSNDIIIGIVLGLTFLVKQNIGFFLCIPTLFIKAIRKIIKRGIGFAIPNIIMLIYLILNKCLYQFIDYTILGLNEFSEKNSFASISCTIIAIISITFIVYKYIKTKEIKYIYILCFHGMIYPIINPYRLILTIIPTLIYILKDIKLNKKIISGAFVIFVISIFSNNMYSYNKGEYSYPNDLETFKYRKLMNKDVDDIKRIANYIKNIEEELFIISHNAYLLKLEAKIRINKYDLLNNGNLGKNGDIKVINEIQEKCSNNKCTFLIDETSYPNHSLAQYNVTIYNYIKENYLPKGNLYNYNIFIYKNY